MEKKYQVFISSTYTDLQKERKKVTELILSTYHFPIGMEMFSAGDSDQWNVIRKTIDKSDYYVLIIGHRYGSLTNDGISYTEKEYNYAKEKGIPIMAFIRDRDFPTTPQQREIDSDLINRLDNFVVKAMENKMCEYWNSPEDLTTKVSVALYKQFIENPRVGWVRANQVPSPVVLEEITELSKENRRLKQDLETVNNILKNKIPKLKLSLNGLSELELFCNPDYESYKIDYINEVKDSAIPMELVGEISNESITKFNESIPEINKKIEIYNQNIVKFMAATKYALELDFNLSNVGQSKANNIYVDITFPKEVELFEGDKGDLVAPEYPSIPNNPIEVARKKRLKTALDSIKPISAVMGSYNFPSHTSGQFNSSSTLFKNLHFDKNNFTRVDGNTITIYTQNLLHTRERSFKEEYLLIPYKIGEYEINVSIICEEYNQKHTYSIPIKVTKINNS